MCFGSMLPVGAIISTTRQLGRLRTSTQDVKSSSHMIPAPPHDFANPYSCAVQIRYEGTYRARLDTVGHIPREISWFCLLLYLDEWYGRRYRSWYGRRYRS